MSAVDIWFDTEADELPTLHGYLLYAALCRHQPALHGAEGLGLHTVHGERSREGRIRPLPGARVGLRLPAAALPLALPLVNRRLDLGGCPLRLGHFEVAPLVAAPSLSTRMATLKHGLDEQSFLSGLERQLELLEVQAAPELGPRMVQRIAGQTIVGFALRLHHLSEAHSLRLLEQGVGGRRRMGCGLLRPSSVSPPEQA